jgi:hypothetical protein
VITRAEAEALILTPKFGDPPGVWTPRPNNGNQQELIFGLCDPQGKQIQGLRVECRVSAGRRVESKRWAFSVTRLDAVLATTRVCSWEILSPELLGHHDERAGKIFGPHERIGPDTLPLDHVMYEWDFRRCVDEFCERITLELEHPIPDPFALFLR